MWYRSLKQIGLLQFEYDDQLLYYFLTERNSLLKCLSQFYRRGVTTFADHKNRSTHRNLRLNPIQTYRVFLPGPHCKWFKLSCFLQQRSLSIWQKSFLVSFVPEATPGPHRLNTPDTKLKTRIKYRSTKQKLYFNQYSVA